MKKTLVLLLALFFAAGTAYSQQRVVQKSFDADENKRIELDLKFGENITVRAWDKKEVSFTAVIEINNGKLNDALLLDFDERISSLYVSSDYNKKLIRKGRREDCDDHYSTYTWNNGDNHAVCSHITYEIHVPGNADLVIESISSDIELVGVKGSIRAKSISGFIDLSWPSQAGAQLSMKTVSGEVYSGLENLKLINKKEGTPLVGYALKGSIGGGGPRVSLESVSGNIYLREN